MEKQRDMDSGSSHSSSNQSQVSHWRYLWLVLICIIAFFVNTDVLPSDIMEARNLVTAHEMVVNDNWLTPTMNGELRLEKPPLPTWIAGFIELAAGESIIAQRAAAGVMGIVWAVFFLFTVDVICRRRKVAVMATLIFLTCYNVVLMGRTATWDIYCHAFMQGALWLLYKIYYGKHHSHHNKRIWEYIFAGLLLGLSFLSKGPVSFFAMLLPFAIACGFVGRKPAKGSVTGAILMVVIAVGVSAWWYIYNYCFHTEIATGVLNKESSAWVSHNVRPIWYYWRFFLETGIWALLTLASVIVPFFSTRLREKSSLRFAIVWTFATVILLSLMPEKKMRYLLPLMAPCSMAIAIFLNGVRRHWKHHPGLKLIFRINGWIITAITVALAGGVIYMWYWLEKLNGGIATIAVISLLVVAFFMGRCVVYGKVYSFVDMVAVLFIIIECLLMSPIAQLFAVPAPNSIRGIRNIEAAQRYPIYISDKEPVRMELVQAAGRNITPIDYKDAKALIAAMPCVVLTDGYVSQTLPSEVIAKADTVYIDTYDENHHPKTSKHYTSLLRKRATILKQK